MPIASVDGEGAEVEPGAGAQRPCRLRTSARTEKVRVVGESIAASEISSELEIDPTHGRHPEVPTVFGGNLPIGRHAGTVCCCCADLRIRLHGVRVAFRGAGARLGNRWHCPDCEATNVSKQFSSFAVHGVAKWSRARRWGRRLLRRLVRLRPLGPWPWDDWPKPLTPAAHAQLQAELEKLEGPARVEMVEAISSRAGTVISPRTSSTTRRRTSRGYWSGGSRSSAHRLQKRHDRRRGGGRGERRCHRRLQGRARARRRHDDGGRDHERRRCLAGLAGRTGAAREEAG